MPGPLGHFGDAVAVVVVALGAAGFPPARRRQDRQQVQRLHVVARRPRHEAAELVGHGAQAARRPLAEGREAVRGLSVPIDRHRVPVYLSR